MAMADTDKINKDLAFTVLYGNEFRLKQLCVVGERKSLKLPKI